MYVDGCNQSTPPPVSDLDIIDETTLELKLVYVLCGRVDFEEGELIIGDSEGKKGWKVWQIYEL